MRAYARFRYDRRMNGILHKTPKVALFLATTEKAGRDKFQGILRYVRLHTPWNIHLVENRMGEQQLRIEARSGGEGEARGGVG